MTPFFLDNWNCGELNIIPHHLHTGFGIWQTCEFVSANNKQTEGKIV